MSDTGKTLLWIVVAIIVIAVIIWLFVSARRNRQVEAQRQEAAALRAHAEERLAKVQRYGDRASVTQSMATQARAEAEQKAAEARRLEQAGAMHQATAEAARQEHELLGRRADRIDPDVRTDDEGFRLDERADHHVPAREPSDAAAVFAHEDEDEEDLADAENPFATTTTDAPESMTTPESVRERDSYEAEPDWPSEPFVSTQPTEATHPADAQEHADPREGPSAVTAGAATGAVTAEGAVADRTPDDASETGTVGTSPSDSEAATTEEAQTVQSDSDDTRDDDQQDRDLERTDPGQKVAEAVPALKDRDEYVSQGGTPGSDPGDHRGQPWATTPGVPGPEPDVQEEEEGQPSGLDVDMSPTGHTGEPAGYDEADEVTQSEDEAAAGATSAGEHGPTERRISSFDEVTDGGYGIGSAAPIGDGAQPLGHAVKGTRDGNTFLAPGDAGYDDADPDVWFYNEEAARRAGFNRKGE